MKKKILIIGSTGKLGSKLLSFTSKNLIPVFCITCFKNIYKLTAQKKRYNIKKSFVLSNLKDEIEFLKLLEKNIDIIYFLDFGSSSLKYLSRFLKYNTNSIIAIANKEMIIAGGPLLQSKIKKSNNFLVPLDSEHFSLYNSNIENNKVQKIYITASGGPFYFNKKINLSTVSKSRVLSHPKWKMGKNNLIDSSNFINKILEIYELSYIYKIPLSKIDFLISKEAYIHSIIHYKDSTLTINAFHNDMIITLIKPLSFFYKIKSATLKQNYFNVDNLIVEKPQDARFTFFKYKNKLLKLSHSEQIKLMIINNSAHKLYLSNKLKYNDIIDYIMKNIMNNSKNIRFKNFDSILKFISVNNDYYKANV